MAFSQGRFKRIHEIEGDSIKIIYSQNTDTSYINISDIQLYSGLKIP